MADNIIRFSSESISGMDDGGKSEEIKNIVPSSDNVNNTSDLLYKSILHSHNIYEKNEIDLINKTYRFGVFNQHSVATTTKEFLFFTLPDLSIFKRNDPQDGGNVISGQLNNALNEYPYWREMSTYRSRLLKLLQSSAIENGDPFNHLLQNQVISNLEIPGLNAEVVDTPVNMYGVGFSYRGSSEASNDSFEFSLEFKDTKWLDVYQFFKAYEEYETLKHHGVVAPYKQYIVDKVIHDQFSIYKFLVDEDMETLLYWAKFYGVMPKSVPREVFSNATFDNGISYSVEFKAAFFEDMTPEIIGDFNALSAPFYDSLPYRVDIYNDTIGRIDNRPAKAAFIEKDILSKRALESPNKFIYKLVWKGDDDI